MGEHPSGDLGSPDRCSVTHPREQPSRETWQGKWLCPEKSESKKHRDQGMKSTARATWSGIPHGPWSCTHNNGSDSGSSLLLLTCGPRQIILKYPLNRKVGPKRALWVNCYMCIKAYNWTTSILWKRYREPSKSKLGYFFFPLYQKTSADHSHPHCATLCFNSQSLGKSLRKVEASSKW